MRIEFWRKRKALNEMCERYIWMDGWIDGWMDVNQEGGTHLETFDNRSNTVLGRRETDGSWPIATAPDGSSDFFRRRGFLFVRTDLDSGTSPSTF